MPQLVNIVLCNLLIVVLSQVEKLRPRFFVSSWDHIPDRGKDWIQRENNLKLCKSKLWWQAIWKGFHLEESPTKT